MSFCVSTWMSCSGPFFFYLFTWRICCCCDWRHLLFLAQPVFNLGLKERGVRGFLVPHGVQALVWALSNPLPLPEFAFISDSKEQLLWFICLWSEKDFTRHFLHRNLQLGELQPTARPFQSSVAHAQQIAQPSPPPAALLNGKEDELHPLQLCYVVLLKDLFVSHCISSSSVLDMIF